MSNSIINLLTSDMGTTTAFYQGANLNPCTPMAAPCSWQGATGLSNICLPFDHKWLKPPNAPDVSNKYFPKVFTSNQSPGLYLLFDRYIAYLAAEHE